jgi:hypothetical protein
VFVNCVARCLENGAGIGDCVISIVSLLLFVIVHSKASVTSLVSSKLIVARVARSMYSELEGSIESISCSYDGTADSPADGREWWKPTLGG